MAALEQAGPAGDRPMSVVLWDLFTGSAPYREVFFLTLTPRFVARFLWRSARAALSSLRRRAEEPIQA